MKIPYKLRLSNFIKLQRNKIIHKALQELEIVSGYGIAEFPNKSAINIY
jgi:hypothetical protein